ncbi:ABC transporter permease [Phenylobacterium sp.]|uniref:ABC transporter permease n=2 Tax=Phenylobacterium sp. TaxID=1871053 RepID=UPI002717F0FC|nr:ABC transporter permease [Phenylobacterium sp.]MDO8802112.1 ABC transporter permease [Phenylobacterium sp.]
MPAERRPLSRTALAWMMVGEWRAHPGRVVTAALAIAIGVALGFAVHLINGSAQNELAQAVRTVNADADLQVHATTPLGFDERLYPALARSPGIAAASPVVELSARFGTGPSRSLEGGGLTVLGVDPLRAATVTPSLLGRGAAPAAGAKGFVPESLFDPRAIVLSPAALSASGGKVGEVVTITAAGRTVDFVVAGVLSGAASDPQVAVLDIATAQWLFGSLGRLQRVDLKFASGANPAAVEAALRARLPADAQIVTAQSEARRGDNLTKAYRVNLEMLAMMALLTGGFLVYSAQSLSVARRRPQFALLRVLGLERRGLLAQVFVEGALVGGVGAVLGLGLGLGVAVGTLKFLGGDLGGGYFRGVSPDLVVTPLPILVFFILGLAAALLGSLLPALEAARAQPGIALKDLGDKNDPNAKPAAWWGFGLLAAGGAAAFLPAVGGLPLFGYLSIGLMLAGGVAAMPWLSRVLLSPLQGAGRRNVSIDLALKRLWGAPSQAAVALCGIVASTSLMVAMAVMVASLRGSVDDWLTEILPSDLLFRVESGGFDADTRARIAKAPGVRDILFQKTLPLRLSSDMPPLVLLVRPVDKARPDASLPMIGRILDAPDGVTPVWLSEPAARLYGREVGERMVLPLGGANPQVFVAGVWRDYARQAGAIAIDQSDYTRLTGDDLRTEASLELKPGATPAGAARAIRAALPPDQAAQVQFFETRQMRAIALRLFDSSFALTYALEAIAIVVGLAGVAATFSAQTLARTKEFGMLRHVGVLRRQIILMLAVEGGLLGAVGVIAGLGLGLAMSQVLIHVVNPQSFHWTMETRLPLPLFASLTVALIAAGAGTAVLAGRRALSADAVRAVREDW